jgi:hypothetical protein
MIGLVSGIISSVAGNVLSSGLFGSMLSNILGSLGSLVSNLISQFGQNDVASASSNTYLQGFSDGLKSVIDGSSLPQGLKDAVKDFIDDFLSTEQSSSSYGCQSAVDSSDYGSALSQAGYSNAKALGDETNEECSGEGGSGKNWLVALAGSLGELQHKFLEKALENMDTMESTAGNDDQEKEFLKAQSEYQANIQMFNMMANMTATSLKTLGEGLTAIARKQ